MQKLTLLFGLLIGLYAQGAIQGQQSTANNYINHTPLPGGVKIVTATDTLYIYALLDGILEVNYNDTSNLSDAIILKKGFSMAEVSETGNSIQISTKSVTCSYQKESGELSFYRSNDTLTQKAYRKANTFQFELKPREQITGGGARALPMNRRGYRLNLRNEPHYGYGYGQENLNFSVPFFISSNNYGIFFNNGSAGYADIGKASNDVFELSGSYDPAHYVVIFGDDVSAVVDGFYQLTGTQPLPPIWALGQFISRFGYETQQEVYDISNRFLDEAIPSDAVIIDLFWFKGSDTLWNMGNLNWHQDFPKPNVMLDSLEKSHHKTILITEPFILQSSVNFAEADSLGILAKDSTGNTGIIENFYFGPTGLIDIFNPKAKSWFWNKYQQQIELGVDGWWGDLGEPEKHPAFLMHQTGPAHKLTNLFGHEWSKMLYTAYAGHYPNTRLFHLNRSGFAGSQRYAGYPWSGDVGRNWSGLKAQIPIMVGMSMCGMPYMHSDLGGFSLTNDPQDAELYIRWMQMGVFTPVFRPHAGDPYPSELVYWPDSVKNILKPYISLRYRMLPYNYSLAYEQAKYGRPMVAPFYNEGNDTAFISEEFYYWGDAFLVAPVTEKGKNQRTINLPEGNWYYMPSGEMLNGRQKVHIACSLNQQPVFIKAGSIVPLTSAIQHTEQYNGDTITWHVFLDTTDFSSSYTLFNDDGLSATSLKNQQFELIHCAVQRKGKKIEVQLKLEGEYVKQPNTREMEIVFHMNEAGSVHTKEKAIKKIDFDHSKHTLIPFSKECKGNQVFKFTWNNQEVKYTFSMK